MYNKLRRIENQRLEQFAKCMASIITMADQAGAKYLEEKKASA